MKYCLTLCCAAAITLSGCQMIEGLAPEPKQSQHGTVVSVEDGDTVVVAIDGREERIRFCGIDAPEMKQPLGEQSRNALQSLVIQANGKVSFVVTDTDRYGRAVAELFVPDPQPGNPENEKFLNAEMVKSGNAFMYPRYVGNCPNAQVIKQAEAEAKQAQVGVFRSPDFQKPWDWRRANR